MACEQWQSQLDGYLDGELSAEETELAGSLARDKYGTHDWTWSGRAPRALTIV